VTLPLAWVTAWMTRRWHAAWVSTGMSTRVTASCYRLASSQRNTDPDGLATTGAGRHRLSYLLLVDLVDLIEPCIEL